MDLDKRASDRERDATAGRLRQALVDGRIEPLEFDERVGRVYAARMRSELAVVTGDLPTRRSLSVHLPRRARQIALYLLVNVLVICLWMADTGARDPLIVGDSETPWLLAWIVASGTVLGIAARRRRLE